MYFSARIPIYILCFLGVLINFHQRVDLCILIFSMTNPPGPIPEKGDVCYSEPYQIDPDGKYLNWDAYELSYVMGSYYWTYFASDMLAYIRGARRAGPKLIVVVAELLNSLCKLFFPYACKVGVLYVVLSRCTEGFVSGLQWPCFLSVLAEWTPEEQREQSTMIFSATPLGVGGIFISYGLLHAALSWEMFFHIIGAIGIVWCALWMVFVYDSPSAHPFISRREREYLEAYVTKKREVPWLLILHTPALWLAAIANFGRIWMSFVCILYYPMYLRNVYGCSRRTTGLVAGAPFVASCFVRYPCVVVAKWIKRAEWVSVFTVRRVFQFVAQVVPAVLAVGITVMGCNWHLMVAAWSLIVVLGECGHQGAMAVAGDVAPNYTGPITVLQQFIQMSACVAFPFAVAFFTKDGHTLQAWDNVLYLSAGVGVLTYIPFLFFGTSYIQTWNWYVDNTTVLVHVVHHKEEAAIPDSRKKHASGANIVASNKFKLGKDPSVSRKTNKFSRTRFSVDNIQVGATTTSSVIDDEALIRKSMDKRQSSGRALGGTSNRDRSRLNAIHNRAVQMDRQKKPNLPG